MRHAGIPVAVLLAPVIPVLTDAEMESILASVHQAGALSTDYILLRLPLEVSALFKEWLYYHYPDMAEHVLKQIQSARNGKDNDARFEHRLRGQGLFAEMIAQRFRLASQKLKLDQALQPLNTQLFNPMPSQMTLF